MSEVSAGGLSPAGTELVAAFEERAVRQSHSVGLMLVFLRMVISAIGYRPTARALSIVAPLLPGGRSPSANGGQMWVLRMGLFELRRAREVADDWVWLIDHTMQAGRGKCFVVFGVRLSCWRAKIAAALATSPPTSVCLEHADLSVWMIERIESSSGAIVQEQLERLSAATGIVPCSVLSDQGADVRLGSELYCEVGERSTVLVHDIAHAVANALKRQLASCPEWARFLAEANACKTQIRQTACAFLMPPELKAKARWMNLESLVTWSVRVRAFLDHPQEALARAQATASLELVEQKMGWLRDHSESLKQWATLLEAASTSLEFIRQHGYHTEVPPALRTQLSRFVDGPAHALVEEVMQFVEVQSARAGEQRLLGSSEVLESLLGKGKQMMGRAGNGFTKSVLGIAAAVTDLSSTTLQTALASTTVRDVQNWIRDHIGLSLPAQRQRALSPTLSGTLPG